MHDQRPPILPFAGAAAARATGDEDPDEREPGATDRDAMPEHEIDDDRAVGGGMMGAGGTAVDRGTGTLGGDAQGDAAGDDVEEDLDVDLLDPGRDAGGRR